MNEKLIVEFSTRENKTHSVRWNADDKDSALSSVYIRKPLFSTAKRIRVTVEEVSE